MTLSAQKFYEFLFSVQSTKEKKTHLEKTKSTQTMIKSLN